MRLVVTEKNDAAQKIAGLLAQSKPKADKVYNTPVYRFEREGEEWVTIGLRGHILEPDFVEKLEYGPRKGWVATDAAGNTLNAELPADLPKPPFKKKKPFFEKGVELKAWKMEALPYLIYAPIQKLPKEKDIIRSLKNLAKKASSVIIATDFDREGELIGSDALSCIQEINPTAPVSRARYSAFTQKEITEAFDNLVELDVALAQAGSSRQDIDLIWGAVLTRYLTLVKFAGYGNVRSSGRVQTPTLALVVARERERLAFVPEKYWTIKAQFAHKQEELSAMHETARFKSKEEADRVMAAVEHAQTGTVAQVEKKLRKAPAPVPFNTTSLMAAASAEGLSPARTMRIAESLYMDGYISYPRVDNTVYPASMDLKEVVTKLKSNPAYAPYCDELLKKPLVATRGKKETTDHPPIYPTAGVTPDQLDASSYKLYNLIARRFLATLSEPAVIEGTKLKISVEGESFVAKGDVIQKPGFRAIYPFGLKKDEQLPQLEEGQVVDFLGAECTEKQTEPPARYSQGKLIQEMEKLGLGTKSTRHAIIERLYAVKYVQNDPLEPSQLGMAVCDALDKFAPHITHPEMTAELEQEMDDIAEGKREKSAVVEDSRKLLSEQLAALIPHSDEVNQALSDAVAADAYVGPCPRCGKDLQLRVSQKTRSMFIGCSGWPDCDVIYPLPKGKVEATTQVCSHCGSPQIKVTPFRAKAQLRCIDPECASNQEPTIPVGECPTCKAAGKSHKLLAMRNPRSLKRFIRCENYEECNTSYPLPQYGDIQETGEACEACGAPIVQVTSSRGPWKFCPNFDCPAKEEEQAARASKSTKKTASKSKNARSKSTSKKSTAQ